MTIKARLERIIRTSPYFHKSGIHVVNKLVHASVPQNLSAPCDDSLKSYKPITPAGALL